MRINFSGNLVEGESIRAGFIGCGAHSFRNVYPTFQFAPVELCATCDLSLEKANAYAKKFGAERAYSDYKEMFEKEKLDAVFIVVGYDKLGRPLYPQIVIDALNAGLHVWLEKPPAASCAEIEKMQAAAQKNNKNVLVGFKKMFFPANDKAKELMGRADFGKASMIMAQYPQYVPTSEEFAKYNEGNHVGSVVSFLDHLCHPVSLLLHLAGMPETLYYQRSKNGAGSVVFTYSSGMISTLALTHGASQNGGMERTVILSDSWRHITVDNNHKVTYHITPPSLPYGAAPSFFNGTPEQTSAVWEPEFSLGNLYNKGLFLLGYYAEVAEFANSILQNRKPDRATLADAWQVTHIFESFSQGAGKTIPLKQTPFDKKI